MRTAKRGSREAKGKIVALLQSDDFEQKRTELLQWPARQVINPLFSFILSTDEQTRWRAITLMGGVIANLAEQEMESARVVMRRFMWMLNDESGGIGWGAPEAIAEVIACHERLGEEYAPVLVSYVWEEGNFLEYEPLQRGAVWGIGRVAQAKPALVRTALPYLIAHLGSADAPLRGLAAWGVGLLGAGPARPQLEALLDDEAEISLYLDRELVRRRVGQLAQEALAAIPS